MRILERALIAELARTFAFALAVFGFVFFLGAFYELLREDIPTRLVLRLIPFAVGYTVQYLVPVALLVACAFTYGRMAADNEVLPILSAGIHPGVLLRPGLYLGLVLTLLLYGAQATLVPYCYRKKRDLQKEFILALLNLGDGEDRIISDHKTFFLYCRSCTDNRIEGIQLIRLPQPKRNRAPRPSGAVLGAKSLTMELTARRGQVIERPAGGVGLKFQGVEISAFEPTQPTLSNLDTDRDGHVTEVEWHGHVPFATLDGDSNGLLSQGELDLYLAAADYTHAARGRPHRGSSTSATFDLAPEARRRYRMGFRSNRQLLAYSNNLEGWRAWYDNGGPVRYRATMLANALAMRALIGGAPPFIGLSSAVAATSPGPGVRNQVEQQIGKATAILHERSSLTLTPLVFSLIASVIPLILRHNNRLAPFFLAFVTVAVTYFMPYFVARSVVDDGLIPPGIAFWTPVGLTLTVGLLLLWRLVRR